MLKSDDKTAVKEIRTFLDELCYGYLNYRLIPGNDTVIFPEFGQLQGILKGFSPLHRLIFSVFRQGHAAEEPVLKRVLGPSLFAAFVDVGLLVKDRHGDWRTPSVAIVPIEGLYLVASLPPYYRNALTTKQPIYLGMESVWLTRVLPPSLSGQTVLDVCSGSGIQGLVALTRGARSVVALERELTAVAVSRFNAVLNGFESAFDIRQSDLYSALSGSERFDLVLSNPPFMPVIGDVDYPICGSGGVDGMDLLRPILSGLEPHMNDAAEAWIFCNALGSQYGINFNRDVLPSIVERDRLLALAHVTDKASLETYVKRTLLPNLRNTCPEIPDDLARAKAEAWKKEIQSKWSADQVYGQVLRIRRAKEQGYVKDIPVYDATATDPLIAIVSTAYNAA